MSSKEEALTPAEQKTISFLQKKKSSNAASSVLCRRSAEGLVTKVAYFGVALTLVYLGLNVVGLASPLIAIVFGGGHFLNWLVGQSVSAFMSATGSLLFCYPIAVFIVLGALYNWINSLGYADSIDISKEGIRIGWVQRPMIPVYWDDMTSVFLFCPHHTMLPRKWLVGLGFGHDGRRPVTIKLTAFEGKGQLLLETIKAEAPSISIDPALIELWEPVIADSHTELWLKSLSNAPKGEHLLPLFPGQRVRDGRYLIVSRLGVGGQGTAYLAQDEETKSSVVVKETLFPVYVDPSIRGEAERRFKFETELLNRLQHTQIVALHESFIEDHRGYLILEYIEGESLRQAVKRQGAFPESRVHELALQMVDVLVYLHELDPAVIHRDFTPDNLMLDREGKAKLIDFNVAREAESTRTATVVGKHAYLPPEQFRGDACLQSDIYAFGATLFFLLVGEDPEPISQSHPREHRPDISEGMDNLVALCTDTELESRCVNARRIKELLTQMTV